MFNVVIKLSHTSIILLNYGVVITDAIKLERCMVDKDVPQQELLDAARRSAKPQPVPDRIPPADEFKPALPELGPQPRTAAITNAHLEASIYAHSGAYDHRFEDGFLDTDTATKVYAEQFKERLEYAKQHPVAFFIDSIDRAIHFNPESAYPKPSGQKTAQQAALENEQVQRFAAALKAHKAICSVDFFKAHQKEWKHDHAWNTKDTERNTYKSAQQELYAKTYSEAVQAYKSNPAANPRQDAYHLIEARLPNGNGTTSDIRDALAMARSPTLTLPPSLALETTKIPEPARNPQPIPPAQRTIPQPPAQQATPNPPSPTPPNQRNEQKKAGEQDRIAQLEQRNADLSKQLDTANRKLAEQEKVIDGFRNAPQQSTHPGVNLAPVEMPSQSLLGTVQALSNGRIGLFNDTTVPALMFLDSLEGKENSLTRQDAAKYTEAMELLKVATLRAKDITRPHVLTHYDDESRIDSIVLNYQQRIDALRTLDFGQDGRAKANGQQFSVAADAKHLMHWMNDATNDLIGKSPERYAHVPKVSHEQVDEAFQKRKDGGKTRVATLNPLAGHPDVEEIKNDPWKPGRYASEYVLCGYKPQSQTNQKIL